MLIQEFKDNKLNSLNKIISWNYYAEMQVCQLYN
jgi:hypothetical protein